MARPPLCNVRFTVVLAQFSSSLVLQAMAASQSTKGSIIKVSIMIIRQYFKYLSYVRS